MEKKDIVIAVFGAAVGLAGILLVFVGFVYSRSETFDLEATRTKYARVAKVGIVPFLLSLASAALCLRWMLYQSATSYNLALCSFYWCMGLTALYGIVAFIFYL